VTGGEIRQLLDRDWTRLADAKTRTWQAAKGGPAADLRAADQLRRYVLAVRRDWPDPLERAGDLGTHIRVSEALGAVRVRSH